MTSAPISNQSTINVIKGNILYAKDKYIVHQTNCCTINAKGLAKDLFKKYPWANIYKNRENKHSTPGTIEISSAVNIPMGCRDISGRTSANVKDKIIVGLMGQYYPGKANYSDTVENRQQWFKSGLLKLSELLKPGDTVAFPYKIGCGLAGGDWNTYMNIITEWCKSLNGITINIYKL